MSTYFRIINALSRVFSMFKKFFRILGFALLESIFDFSFELPKIVLEITFSRCYSKSIFLFDTADQILNLWTKTVYNSLIIVFNGLKTLQKNVLCHLFSLTSFVIDKITKTFLHQVLLFTVPFHRLFKLCFNCSFCYLLAIFICVKFRINPRFNRLG
jgi:hypothetical protein